MHIVVITGLQTIGNSMTYYNTTITALRSSATRVLINTFGYLLLGTNSNSLLSVTQLCLIIPLTSPRSSPHSSPRSSPRSSPWAWVLMLWHCAPERYCWCNNGVFKYNELLYNAPLIILPNQCNMQVPSEAFYIYI